jgi:hypothetical protein
MCLSTVFSGFRKILNERSLKYCRFLCFIVFYNNGLAFNRKFWTIFVHQGA